MSLIVSNFYTDIELVYLHVCDVVLSRWLIPIPAGPSVFILSLVLWLGQARGAEITFRAWAPSQRGAGAKLPSDPKCALFPHHKTENYCFMVIRHIIMYTGMCTIQGNRRRSLSYKGWELEILESADFYCYNCLTFHRAENIVLC